MFNMRHFIAADRPAAWEPKERPFKWSSQAGTELATTPFPFQCSKLASALLLRPSNAENEEIPSFLPASAERPRGLNSAKQAIFSKAVFYRKNNTGSTIKQRAYCQSSLPVVWLLLEDSAKSVCRAQGMIILVHPWKIAPGVICL